MTDWSGLGIDWTQTRRYGNGDLVRTCAVLVLCALSALGGVVLGVVGYAWR